MRLNQSNLSRNLLRWLAPYRWQMMLAVTLGVGMILGGVGLITTSSVLISKAGLHPSIAELGVIIVGVRFFGLSRAVLRYFERLISHDLRIRQTSTRVALETTSWLGGRYSRT